MDYGDYWGLYRGYCRDPLRTRQFTVHVGLQESSASVYQKLQEDNAGT